MRIDRLELNEFRGYEHKTFTFDPHFNVLIGKNGSGKTTVLEALTIAINPFVSVIEGKKNIRPIKKEDVRRVSFQLSIEAKIDTSIIAEGLINTNVIEWKARKMRDFGYVQNDDFLVRQWAKDCLGHLSMNGGTHLVLPLFCYMGASRLWTESTEKVKIHPRGSRLEGYDNCLNAKGHFKRFVEWFKTMELSALQKNVQSKLNADIVRKVVASCLEGWDTIFYSVVDDMLMAEKKENNESKTLPFHYLSDGQRNMIGLIADIAYRCILLNPYLGEKAVSETPGIVLIDEIDLHLHPNWQRMIVQNLKNAFPKIQFIATTHSPFIVQSLNGNELINLDKVSDVTPKDLSINEVSEDIMGAESEMSDENSQVENLSSEYFKTLLATDGEKASVVKKLDNIEIEISDPGVRAFLKMKRLEKGIE